jgi:dTDP-4-amino-4,6-dideoxygalactose transaminase
MTKFGSERAKKTMEKQGIGLQGGVYDLPLHKQKLWPVSQEFPVADHYLPLHICLPIFRGMTDKQVQQVIKTIQKEDL